MANKPNKSNDDFDFDEAAKRSSTAATVSETVIGFVVAVCTVGVPIFLFSQILSLSLEANFILYAICTLGGAIVLLQAYMLMASSKKATLITSRQRDISARTVNLNGKKWTEVEGELNEQIRSVSGVEALSYSLCFLNAIFLGCVLFFSLVLFKNVSIIINFALTTGCSAAVVYFVAAASK